MNELDQRLLVRLASVAAGRPARWPSAAPAQADSRACTLAAAHGLLALIDYRAREHALDEDWPKALLTLAADTARRQLMVDAMIELELKRVLEPLTREGVRHCLLKGAALAWSHYPEAWTRPRQDTDLLIERAALERTQQALSTLGYQQIESMAGDTIFQQESWIRELAPGIVHEIDLHVEMTNSHAFNAALNAHDIMTRRVPRPELGEHASGPCRTDALLHAVVHRVAHHQGSRRLIWLYDIHLLIEGLDDEALDALVDTAQRQQLLTALGDGVAATHEWFESATSGKLLQRLDAARPAARLELTHRLALHGAGRLRLFLTDLRAIGAMDQRLKFLKENLFPPEAWLRKHFGANTGEAIVWPFMRRLARGLTSLRS